MYCPQCGAANDDSAGVCGTCGFDLVEYRQRWQTPGAQGAEQQPAGPYSAPPYRQPHEPAYRTPQYDAPPYGHVAPYMSIPRVPSYLGWAIAVLILCFWPTGIAAVVYASQVDNKLVMGDVDGARESSRKAKLWCWISFGISIGLFFVGLLIVIFATAIWTTSSSIIS